MDTIECKICQKIFTGLVCFQQHEASDKHKKKVLLSQMRGTNTIPQHQEMANNVDSQIIHCAVCEISLMGLPNYEKHVNSMPHADMVKQKKSVADSEPAKENLIAESYMPVSFSASALEPFARCPACDMQFSGPEPYQQHLASEKHKKKSFRKDLFDKKLSLDTVDDDKISFKNESQNERKAGNVEPFAECSYCDMQFSGFAPYQLHVESKDHLRKVSNSSMPTLENPKTGNNVLLPKQEVQDVNGGNRVKSFEPFAECSFCNMKFTGPEPYQLHIDSEAHKRKVSFYSNKQDMVGPQSSQDQFKCDVCNKNFSGPIPYDDHMRSIVHKKKVQNVGFLQSISATPSMQPDSTTSVPEYPVQNSQILSPLGNQSWYCEVCDKQSTGQIPHDAHLASQGHEKKIRAAEMEKNLKIRREMLMQPHIQDAFKLKIEKENELSKDNQLNSNLAYNKDFYISNDLILCDALKNIGVIPQEELNVTVFYPEDEIVFA